ncbi:MAG: FAD-dependent oxidoreductase [Elusimicrobia bacterium]|nr:FAD-dependent oxidoreductase [Elusimicrobiota bacterium]
MSYIVEPKRKIPVAGDCDVLVCGGGAAGYCAAVASARNGARTTLIERHGFLGGSATQALVLPLMTFHAAPDEQVVKGIGEEIVQEVMRLGGSPGHLPDPLGCAATFTPADPEWVKFAILKLVHESKVQLHFHSFVAGALLTGRRVSGVVVENKSGRQAFRAQVVIDATGDGDVAEKAGARLVHGRAADGKTQPLTLMFRMYGVDAAAVRRYVRENPREFVLTDEARRDIESLPVLAVSGFFGLVKKAQAAGDFGGFRDRVLYFEMPKPGEVMVNMTRVGNLSGVNARDLSAAELAGLAQVQQSVKFLKKYIPGFSDAALLEVAAQIGVRETRHLAGRYTLTAEDVLAGRKFADGIARGAFPIDIHSPDGSGLTMKKMEPGACYDIPFRCMLPKEVEGLLVTGRAISATYEASASSRLSPTCMALGEAAGTAAALAVKRKVWPSKLDPELLRETLRRQGAVV